MIRGDRVGYRIVYEPDFVNAAGRKDSTRIRIMISCGLLIFALVVRLLWPEGREVLTEYLLSKPTLAQSAFSDLLENLRCGSGMVESLTVFCREVLDEIV